MTIDQKVTLDERADENSLSCETILNFNNNKPLNPTHRTTLQP